MNLRIRSRVIRKAKGSNLERHQENLRTKQQAQQQETHRRQMAQGQYAYPQANGIISNGISEKPPRFHSQQVLQAEASSPIVRNGTPQTVSSPTVNNVGRNRPSTSLSNSTAPETDDSFSEQTETANPFDGRDDVSLGRTFQDHVGLNKDAKILSKVSRKRKFSDPLSSINSTISRDDTGGECARQAKLLTEFSHKMKMKPCGFGSVHREEAIGPVDYGATAGYGGGDKINDSIYVPSDAVHMIIGKGGKTIKDMQPSSGPSEVEREIGLVGSRDAIIAAKRAIQDEVDALVR
jgi:hypothetical protein